MLFSPRPRPASYVPLLLPWWTRCRVVLWLGITCGRMSRVPGFLGPWGLEWGEDRSCWAGPGPLAPVVMRTKAGYVAVAAWFRWGCCLLWCCQSRRATPPDFGQWYLVWSRWCRGAFRPSWGRLAYLTVWWENSWVAVRRRARGIRDPSEESESGGPGACVWSLRRSRDASSKATRPFRPRS